MYICSICKAEVVVDHINPPIKSCLCTDGTIIASMGAGLAGKGAMNAFIADHNLSTESMAMLRALLPGIASIEFFRDNQTEIYLNDQVVIDQPTGRRFVFTLTGKEHKNGEN